jgi:hypothetical protein
MTERTAMNDRKTGSSAGLLALLLLALLATALTGCGIGRASNEEKISKTATTYLRALAHADIAKACAELTRRAERGRCKATVTKRLSEIDADALTKAADGSMDIDVHGSTATAGLSDPQGARFFLKKVGEKWLIDSGYTVGSAG